MLRSLQTSDSWPSFVRRRLTPPTSTPSVVESMNVVFVKSTITCFPPWPITSSSCCLNSGAVYRSTSPAREMTYESSEICSVLMSKFMGPPVEWQADRGASLLGGRSRGGGSRLDLQLLDLRLHLGDERVVRGEPEERLVCGERRGRVGRRLRRLGELQLRVRVVRGQPRELLVGLLGALLGALVVRVRSRLLRRRELL